MDERLKGSLFPIAYSSMKIPTAFQKRLYRNSVFGTLFSFALIHCDATEDPLPDHLVELAWAYAITIEPPPPLPEDEVKHSLPGTPLTFTRDEIVGRKDGVAFQTAPADWYPGDHPEMPEIYAKGDPERNIIACALCHYPNGKGKAENAPPAGQSEGYLIQQLLDFQNDLRKCADPRKSNYELMIETAKGMTEQEIIEVSAYLESMKWTQWIDVIETRTVPKTYLRGGLHIPIEGPDAGTEPIGKRIIESPVDSYKTEFLRDPRSGCLRARRLDRERRPVGSHRKQWENDPMRHLPRTGSQWDRRDSRNRISFAKLHGASAKRYEARYAQRRNG